ncbi:unnamed protein product, partial [Iphiclides podalirius]
MLLTVSICATALIGDYIVFKSKYSDSQAFRAFSDSSVHASIGFLSALIFFSYDIGLTDQARAYNIAFCTLLSSIIDVDHFIAAKSFRLKDLTHLKQRGIFHCTTFWFILTAMLLVYASIAKKLNVYILAFMIIIAFTSHHMYHVIRLYATGHPSWRSPGCDLGDALPASVRELSAAKCSAVSTYLGPMTIAPQLNEYAPSSFAQPIATWKKKNRN